MIGCPPRINGPCWLRSSQPISARSARGTVPPTGTRQTIRNELACGAECGIGNLCVLIILVITAICCEYLVPGARIELALCCQNRILNPARLPVPPPGQGCEVYRFQLRLPTPLPLVRSSVGGQNLLEVVLIVKHRIPETDGRAFLCAVDDDCKGRKAAILHTEITSECAYGHRFGQGSCLGNDSCAPVLVSMLESIRCRRNGHGDGAVKRRKQCRLVIHVVEQCDK